MLTHIHKLGLSTHTYPDFLVKTEEYRLSVANNLMKLTQQGFMRQEIDDELTDDVKNHVAYAPRLLIVYDAEDCPRAYICSEVKRWQGNDVYYLHGIMIDPSYQGKGLGRSMIQLEFSALDPDILLLTTQSMNMYKLARKMSRLDTDLAVQLAKEFENSDSHVIKGMYRNGSSLYGDTEKFAQYAIPWINWREGDSLVVAGYIKSD